MKPLFVANLLGVTVFLVRAVLVLIALFIPTLFAWLYGVMFLSPNAPLPQLTSMDALVDILVPAILAWIIGYVLATVHNILSKHK